jgi:hypothetical protein
MAAVLAKLLEGEIPFETFIQRLLTNKRKKVRSVIEYAFFGGIS